MKSVSKLKDDARKLEQKEDWEKAIQIYLQVVAIGEQGEADLELPLYNRIGDLYIRMGRPNDAVGYYEQAADRYAEAGLYNNAIALCNKALRYVPDRFELLRKLGTFSASQGFLTDARRWFLDYAEQMFKRGSADEAIAALEDFANVSEDPEIRELLGRRLHQHGRTDAALQELRRAYNARVRAGQQELADALREEIRAIDPDASVDETAADVAAAPVHHEPHFGGVDLPGLADLAIGGAAEEPAEEAAPEFGEFKLEGFEATHAEAETPALDSTFSLPDLQPTSSAEPDTDSTFSIDLPDLDSASETTSELGSFELPAFDDDDDAHAPLPTLDDDGGAFELPTLDDDDGAAFELPTLDDAEDDAFTLPTLDEAGDDDAVALPSLDDADAFALPTLDDDADGPQFSTEEGPPSFELPTLADADDDAAAEADASLDDLVPAGVGMDGEVVESAEPFAFEVETPTEELVDSGPNVEAAVQAAVAAAGTGDLERAIDALENLHTVAESEEHFRAAADIANVLLASHPNDVRLHQLNVEFTEHGADPARRLSASLRLARAFELAGAITKARAVYQRVLEIDPENEEARAVLAPSPSQVNAEKVEEGYVDLMALIGGDDALEGTRFVVAEKEPTGDEDRDFAELLAQFKAKVAENVSAEDAGSHYDLGLAFKEMGLIDEAIGEFQIAMRSGDERLKIYEELGHCFLLKEQYTVATKILTRATQMKHEDELELIGVYYHLGRAYEEQGKVPEARDAYERVLGLDLNFQDVSQRLTRL